jgi:hypothetical protein
MITYLLIWILLGVLGGMRCFKLSGLKLKRMPAQSRVRLSILFVLITLMGPCAIVYYIVLFCALRDKFNKKEWRLI